MKEIGIFCGGFAVCLAVLFGASQTKCVAPPKPDEAKPGIVSPGTALIAGGQIQTAWMQLGPKTRVWIGDAKDPKSVVELVVEGGMIQVVKDGRQGAGVGP